MKYHNIKLWRIKRFQFSMTNSYSKKTIYCHVLLLKTWQLYIFYQPSLDKYNSCLCRTITGIFSTLKIARTCFCCPISLITMWKHRFFLGGGGASIYIYHYEHIYIYHYEHIYIYHYEHIYINIIMNIYENVSCLKRRLSSSKYLIYYCSLCWYGKIWKICNLQLLGWWGGCWWPSLFQALSLPKKIRTEKALRTCFTNLTFSPQKKNNIHIFRQSALKMLIFTVWKEDV